MDLTYKQRLFISAYLGEANGNATEAARIAGYSEHKVTGHRLLTKANVRAAVDAKLAKAAMSGDEVLARISEIASGDVSHFIKIEGKSYKIDLGQAKKRGKLRLLKKLKETKYGIEIELQDQQAALDKLAKYHGFYDDNASKASADHPLIAKTQELLETMQARHDSDRKKATRKAKAKSGPKQSGNPPKPGK